MMAAPFSPPAIIALRESKRSPPFCFFASWHSQQRSLRIGSTCALKSTACDAWGARAEQLMSAMSATVDRGRITGFLLLCTSPRYPSPPGGARILSSRGSGRFRGLSGACEEVIPMGQGGVKRAFRPSGAARKRRGKRCIAIKPAAARIKKLQAPDGYPSCNRTWSRKTSACFCGVHRSPCNH